MCLKTLKTALQTSALTLVTVQINFDVDTICMQLLCSELMNSQLFAKPLNILEDLFKTLLNLCDAEQKLLSQSQYI